MRTDHFQLNLHLLGYNTQNFSSDILSLRKNCPYSEFFWSVFFRIRTEIGEIRTRKTLNTGTFQAASVM